MAVLASDVMERSRAVLNDIAKDLYTDEVLIPYLKIANDDLSDEMVDHGATVQKEVSADIPLLAGSKLLALPADIIVPIELFTKNEGQSDSYYTPAFQRDFLPNSTPGSAIETWTWREQNINFIGATVNKIVRLRYYRLVTAMLGPITPIELTHAVNYLAYHTAALASEHIGQNRSKAIDLESQAIQKLNKLLKKEVKQTHGRPVRRRRFSLTRFTSYTR
jgi:hypothetical protein